MRFDDRVTGDLKTYAQSAKKIHIELDPAEINKNVKVDVALIGDARTILRELLASELPFGFAPWNEEITALRGDSAVRDIQGLADDGHLYAAHVIHDLWRLTGGSAIVVTDVGQHQMWEAQYWKHDRHRTLITSGGLGTMGFALPAAIGARFAQRSAEIWVIAGDGGFQMTAAELTTIAQEQIKLNIAIINNGYLGMVRQWQQMFYQGRYVATPMKSPDFVALARAHGLDGVRVTRRSDLDAAVQHARSAPGTVLLEFCVEQEDIVYPMVPSGADLRNMIRRPRPVLIETADDR
jgi:acetolactate synthase-1/2/3 large subunit